MDLTILIPVYQAELSIGSVIDSLHELTYLKSKDWEIVLVDDHSTDKSYEIIQQKAKQYSNIKGITLHKNTGQHTATFVGIKEASGKYLITMDDDGEHPIDQIEGMIKMMEDNNGDVVYASPIKRQKSLFRKILSTALKFSNRWFSDGDEYGSAFRLIHRSIYVQIQKKDLAFVFIDEILTWYTKNIHFLKMEFPASLKSTTYSRGNLFGLYYDIIFSYSSLPAQFLTKIGFLGSITSLLVGIYFIVQKLFFKAQLGFTTIAVSILFSASIILFGLGILAQYIYRQSRILNQIPQYSIKHKTHE